jgi:hypothetical protein
MIVATVPNKGNASQVRITNSLTAKLFGQYKVRPFFSAKMIKLSG